MSQEGKKGRLFGSKKKASYPSEKFIQSLPCRRDQG